MAVKDSINPYLYAYYGKLDLSKLSRSEYRRFIKHIRTLPQFDGEGERTVFFKIVEKIPKSKEEIEECKAYNKKRGELTMTMMAALINKTNKFKAEWKD